MEMNVLFCSVGRRVKLVEDFRKTLGESCKIVATDNSNIAPALYVADKKYIVPKIYEKKYIDEIIKICKNEKIKIVCTLIDPEIEILAKNRKKFEELGILLMVSSEETARICFDKYEMYKYAKENDIRTVTTYGTIKEFEENTDGITFPVFVKPRTGSGSIGAEKVKDIETLRALMREDETLIIQELMQGEDLDADIYVDTISKQVVSIFSKRKLETKIGGANKTISFKDKKLNDFIEDIVSKFDFNGAINMDFFCKDGEYYLTEINPRFGGGYVHAYEENVDFIKYLVNNANEIENIKEIGKYDENSIMMMYDNIIVIKGEQ